MLESKRPPLLSLRLAAIAYIDKGGFKGRVALLACIAYINNGIKL
jgi:hypothetical protein